MRQTTSRGLAPRRPRVITTGMGGTQVRDLVATQMLATGGAGGIGSRALGVLGADDPFTCTPGFPPMRSPNPCTAFRYDRIGRREARRL